MSGSSATAHKVAHNMTTLLNVPLVGWLIYSIFALRNASLEDFTTYMASPINIVASILFVGVALYHFTLEIEVVLEDYIANVPLRNCIIKVMKLFWLVLGLTATISILKIGL